MLYKRLIKTTGCLELIIGLCTLVSLIAQIQLSSSGKPVNVFVFVLICSIISIMLGVGLFEYMPWARIALVVFSFYILLTKILIFANIIKFNGEIITFVPPLVKNSVSTLYHSFIIILFNQQKVKDLFKR